MPGADPAEQLTIVVDETAAHGRVPLYAELVHRARGAGLAGATVVHGVEGFGVSTHVHVAAPGRLTQRGMPAVVVIVDTADRIEAFMPVVDELVSEGVAFRRPVRTLRPVRS